MISFSNSNGLAKISYGSSDYLILEAGGYVICAVTGKQIPLDQLRYWSGDRQEAYIDASASLQRWQDEQAVS
jgi:hypothetical protein